MPTTYTPQLTRAFVITLNANSSSQSIVIPSGYVWKIESAGVGGTNGTIYLKSGSDNIAILFSSVHNNQYASLLPFWLDATFSGGTFRNENEGGFKGVISVSEYYLVQNT